MEAFEAVNSFEALAHETRLGVLRLLIPVGVSGMAAGDISKQLNLPPNSLSFHLGRLVNARLIVSRRSGRKLFYAAEYAHVAELVRFLADDCCANAPEGCLPECSALAGSPSPEWGNTCCVPEPDTSRRK